MQSLVAFPTKCYEVGLRVITDALNRELREWEKFYNMVRPHQSLGYLTPAQYLQQWLTHRKG